MGEDEETEQNRGIQLQEFWATCYFIFKLNVAQIFVFWFLVRKDKDFGGIKME